MCLRRAVDGTKLTDTLVKQGPFGTGTSVDAFDGTTRSCALSLCLCSSRLKELGDLLLCFRISGDVTANGLVSLLWCRLRLLWRQRG